MTKAAEKRLPADPQGLDVKSFKQVLDVETLKRLLPDFLEAYKGRAILTNEGGMGFNHSFATYATVRALNPATIIESGVFRGHSTWLLELAAPNAKIYSLDPDLAARTYISPKVTYATTDFAAFDWSQIDRQQTLCFFDDHQSAYSRLKDMSWWGFKWAIFEDNYPCGEGDCYSIRHAVAGFGHPHINMSKRYAGNVLKQAVHIHDERVLVRYYDRQEVLRRPNSVDSLLLARNLEYYQEVPPVIRYPQTIWGNSWEGPYESEPPLRNILQDQKLIAGLNELELIDPTKMFHYNYICVAGLRGARMPIEDVPEGQGVSA